MLCKSKHFPRRYERKREWVFFLNTVYMQSYLLTELNGSRKKADILELKRDKSERKVFMKTQLIVGAETSCV